MSNTLSLKVNTDKTKIMTFRKGGQPAKGEHWYLEGTKLEVVNRYKYLGYVFTTRLSLNTALEDLCIKGKQKSLHILKAMWRLQSMKTNVFIRMLEAQVVPTLLYGAELWGLENPRKVETAHAFALKKFLGLSTKTPNHMVYGDLGRFPMQVYSCVRAIKYWLRLSRMEPGRLPYQAYLMLLRSNISGKPNWASSVKELLQKLGFGYVWYNGGVENPTGFIKQLKRRLKDCFMQEWNSVNKTSERYQWYSTFKTSMGLEDYLNIVEIKKFRDILIRFRFGINDLAVNRSFRTNLDLNCPFCQFKDNEEHLLFECEIYEHIRRKYLQTNHCKGSKLRFCKYWMTTTDATKVRAFAMFLFYVFKLRSECLYLMENECRMIE